MIIVSDAYDDDHDDRENRDDHDVFLYVVSFVKVRLLHFVIASSIACSIVIFILYHFMITLVLFIEATAHYFVIFNSNLLFNFNNFNVHFIFN